MTVSDLNAMDRQRFVETLGWVFEHSPWVADRAWYARPFDNVAALHAAMVRCVVAASRHEQLALIQAHPDLGARARMSDASVGEQAGAGLHQLTAEEFERLQSSNAAYREKFGFPFIYAVKGSTKHDIMQALETRLSAARESEFETALAQVGQIAWFRLTQEIS